MDNLPSRRQKASFEGKRYLPSYRCLINSYNAGKAAGAK